MSELNNPGQPQRRIHGSKLPSTRNILGITFGIFMVIIYVGMGVLLMINFFNWNNDWAWTRWIVGAVLIVYGFFRAWRQYRDFTYNKYDDED